MEDSPVLRKLRALKPRFKDMKLKRVRLFGSFLHGDSGPDSDVDLLVEFLGHPTFFDVMDAREELEKHIGRRVDMVTIDSVYEGLKDKIMREAQDV